MQIGGVLHKRCLPPTSCCRYIKSDYAPWPSQAHVVRTLLGSSFVLLSNSSACPRGTGPNDGGEPKHTEPSQASRRRAGDISQCKSSHTFPSKQQVYLRSAEHSAAHTTQHAESTEVQHSMYRTYMIRRMMRRECLSGLVAREA